MTGPGILVILGGFPSLKLGLVLKLARMSALWNVIVERIYVMLCFRWACMGELAYK